MDKTAWAALEPGKAPAENKEFLARKAAPGATTFSIGERKQVTVLFADFAGFTTFSHQHDAEEVRDRLHTLWSQFDGIIAAHGGVTEKHIGDAIMAVFGARQAREEDPAQAVRAALAIQDVLLQLRQRGDDSLQMRIGIHTGVVVVGPLGSGEFTATGDTVNVANRLEHHAPVGGVLISHDTFRHVYGLFDMQLMPLLNLKGRPEPIQTYVVLKAKPRALAIQLRGVEGAETQMIGREPELRALQTGLQQVIAEQQLQVFTVAGEAGIGKSRLLREFQHWVELLPQNVRWFSGRVTAELAGLPFALVRDIFATRCEIQESDSPAVAREKLERGLAELLPGVSGEEVAEQCHFIGQLVGLDFSASPWLREIRNDTQQIRHRGFYSLSRFLCSTSRGPSTAAALLIAEDVHWSDDGSLDLLGHIARTCQGSPIMIVCLTRPTLFERCADWDGRFGRHKRLPLEPLSRNESRELVETILSRAQEIPQALRELIVGGAEGIPFYIEEIVKMLIDQQVIVPGPDTWRIEGDRLAAARVPATLTGILQARLDALSASERAVLQRASVVGRVFWDKAIESLAGGAGGDPASKRDGEHLLSRETILESLEGLRDKGLIFRRESSAFSGCIEYIFKHELLRSVTYESVLRKLRKEFHAQLGLWLVERSGERSGEFAGLIASHFEQAGHVEEAAAWYGRAGHQARLGYAPAIAVDFFRKAFALLSDDRKKRPPLEWYEGLGETLGAQAQFAAALEAYLQMRRLAESQGDADAQARAWNGLAFLNERLGNNRASIECAEKAELFSLEGGDAGGERIRALHLKGWAYYRLGEAHTVLALGEQTLKCCTELANRPGLATSFKLHGVAHLQLGNFQEAEKFFKQGLELCKELGDHRNTAAMWSNLGESARLRGDCQAAVGLYQNALTIARQIGHRESELIYLTNLGGARLGLGQFAEAEGDLRQALALSASPTCALAETYSFLSEACLGQGRRREALEMAQQALNMARESENHLDMGIAWRALAMAIAANSEGGILDTDAAGIADPDACFEESLKIFREIKCGAEQARTLSAWAERRVKLGQTESGKRLAEEAQLIFSRLAVAHQS